jgi:hypothetical protein
MKKIALGCIFLFFHFMSYAQKDWTVYSPNHSLAIKLSNYNGKLSYQVLSGQEVLIKPSALGIEINNTDFSNNLTFLKTASKKIDEQYTLQIGKRKENRATANETSVVFRDGNARLIQIDVRAYDDGVAFRYKFPETAKNFTVTNETTQFAVPTNGKVWLENYDLPTDYTPAYEGVYADGIAIGTNAKDSGGWAFPALFQSNNHWLLITETNLDRNYFAAHLQQNCENGIYKLALPLQGEAKGTGNTFAAGSAPFSTPWRTIIIGKNVGTVVESHLVYHLADANKVGDVTWVKPGRSSWSWWGDHESSTNFEKLKKFVDLAKEMGWEYSLVDANWNIMKGGGTIQELVKYAAEKNIALLFWYNSGGPHNVVTEQPRDIISDSVKRKEEFKKLRKWGVKGIKVDFFQSDKQHIIQLHHDILEDAAKEELMVNFHGATLPRGWSRTYPNLVTVEAVAGAENYGWGKEFALRAPVHNNILTYTRNVVGPMDYTPVTFSGYECCTHLTTNAHELALSVLFETGILHFADRAASYQNLSNRIKDFMRNVPVTWDDIRFIQGEPGKETVLGRRNKNTWYIAGANGENRQKNMSLQLPFLNGNYKAVIFSDGTTGKEIKVSETDLKKNSTINIAVLPNGGFTVVLTPEEAPNK